MLMEETVFSQTYWLYLELFGQFKVQYFLFDVQYAYFTVKLFELHTFVFILDISPIFPV